MTPVSISYAEFRFETSRSGGPGGQNVNKVETKVRLIWNPAQSLSLTPKQKDVLFSHPGIVKKLNTLGEITITCQIHRTQAMNRDEAIRRLHELLRIALTPQRKRVATRVSRAAKERRVTTKKKHGARKASRRVRGDE